MRNAFMRALLAIAERDERVFLLTGDLGYSVLEPFIRRFPKRYVNVGVAEQNMLGIAAGLAHSGSVVFVYSIANFPTLRCFEQIRNDVAYHALPVRVVSVGGGLSYGSAGYTHHGVEDLAVMRALPGLAVFAPGDPHETELITERLLDLPGPAYLRLGKAGEPFVHDAPPELELGRALVVREGRDVTLVSTGGMLAAALATAHALHAESGLSARVLSMHTLKPFDEDSIVRAARETRLIVTCEEHSEIGGLGSAVADVLARLDAPRARLSKFALPDRATNLVGSQRFLLQSLLGSLTDHVRARVCRAVAKPRQSRG